MDSARENAFFAVFAHPLYADSTGEFAPFGTDEGADILAEWSDRNDELSHTSTLAQILLDGTEGDAEELLSEMATGGADTDSIIIGAGFTLIRLTGQIDPAGRQLVLDALHRSSDHYGAIPEIAQMITDLERRPTLVSASGAPSPNDQHAETVESELPPAKRHAWFTVSADRVQASRERRLPNAYLQHLAWLRTGLNQDPTWWAWWDQGFDQVSKLAGYVSWRVDPRARPAIRRYSRAGIQTVEVEIQTSLDAITAMDPHELARFSLSHVHLARQHVNDILNATQSKYDLPAHPPLPRTRRDDDE